MQPPFRETFRLGEWRVDPQRDEISNDTETTKLEPRAMRLLVYLAENAGRVVGVQELLDHVWANVVVTPQSVYNAVAQLRRVLGDSAETPTYLTSVPRKGYQLIAEVGPALAANRSDPSPAPRHAETAVPIRNRRHAAWVVGGIGAGLAVTAVIVYVGIEHYRRQRVMPVVPVPSIAVLPFLDLSEAKDQQYLADGMTEELIDKLSQIDGLRVPARTSSFYFKGKQITVADLGRALGVGHVLEGSVRKSGARVRITVQLIDTVTGYHLWSRAYDRDLTDILLVESEVATSVADQFKITLVDDELAKFGAGGTTNPDAYDAYLRGEQRLQAGVDRQSDSREALTLFDRALAHDPNYGLALAGRARALDTLALFHSDATGRDDLRQQALAAGERAVALAPDLGESHAALAITRAYGLFDFVGAAPEFERALALAPGNAHVQRLYAEFATVLGHHERAIAAATRAASLDPANASAYITLGRTLGHARRFTEALAALHKAEQLKPGSNYIDATIFGTLLDAGKPEQARDMCSSPAVTLDEANRHFCLALAEQALGRRAEAERHLEKLRAQYGDEGAFEYAEIYAQFGNRASAIEWLKRAEQQRSPSLQSLRVNARLDPIRHEPEFKALEARMKFPP